MQLGSERGNYAASCLRRQNSLQPPLLPFILTINHCLSLNIHSQSSFHNFSILHKETYQTLQIQLHKRCLATAQLKFWWWKAHFALAFGWTKVHTGKRRKLMSYIQSNLNLDYFKPILLQFYQGENVLLKGEEICKLPLKVCIWHNHSSVKYFAQYYNNLSVI